MKATSIRTDGWHTSTSSEFGGSWPMVRNSMCLSPTTKQSGSAGTLSGGPAAKLQHAWFSDSFLIWAPDDSSTSFHDVDQMARIFTDSLLHERIPLRGAISCGSLYSDVASKVFFGRSGRPTRRQIGPPQVGSRTGAVLRRSDLSVAPRFQWECLTSRTVSPFPVPAASNPAGEFLALGFPARFVPRVMGPNHAGAAVGSGRLTR
jgi:hypothetical protein